MAPSNVLDAVVGLGANLADRVQAFVAAVQHLQTQARVVALSPLYLTAPIGPAQPDFYNAAVRLEFAGQPLQLLDLLLDIEREQGRERSQRWGPRTLDLDLLWIEGLVVDSERLQVPHPRLAERAFALLPLLSVAPTARNPGTQQPYVASLISTGATGLQLLDDVGWDEFRQQLLGH